MVDKMIFTRIRAPYVNRDDFTFKISREHLGDRSRRTAKREPAAPGFQTRCSASLAASDRPGSLAGAESRRLAGSGDRSRRTAQTLPRCCAGFPDPAQR
jgi:hypothetical protein